MSDPKANETIKPSIAKLLSILLFNNYRKQERKDLVLSILEDLANSKNMTQRKAFLTFCEQALPYVFTDEGPKMMSKQFFIANFFPSMLAMMNDKVMSVRRKFCSVA